MSYIQQPAYIVAPQMPHAMETGGEEPLLFEVGSTHVGVVKRYNPGRGFGFITAENGNDIFLHQSKIVKEGFRSVAVGDVVRFGVALTDPRMYPTRTVEAVNVEILQSREPAAQDGFQRLGGGFAPKGSFPQQHFPRGGGGGVGGMRGGMFPTQHHHQHHFQQPHQHQQHLFAPAMQHHQAFAHQAFVIPQQGAQIIQQQQQQPTIYLIQAPASTPQYFAIDAATLSQAQAQTAATAQPQPTSQQPTAFVATGPTGETQLFWTTASSSEAAQ